MDRCGRPVRWHLYEDARDHRKVLAADKDEACLMLGIPRRQGPSFVNELINVLPHLEDP